MEVVESIPNEPDQLVAVTYFRSLTMPFGPQKGKVIKIRMRFVGASAREISAEVGSDQEKQYPVVWRFIHGARSGGDDPQNESAWTEVRVEVPPSEADVKQFLEQEAFPAGKEFTWYVLKRS